MPPQGMLGGPGTQGAMVGRGEAEDGPVWMEQHQRHEAAGNAGRVGAQVGLGMGQEKL